MRRWKRVILSVWPWVVPTSVSTRRFMLPSEVVSCRINIRLVDGKSSANSEGVEEIAPDVDPRCEVNSSSFSTSSADAVVDA